MYRKKFGKNLKILLELRGITAGNLAKMLDVSAPMITRYCKGQNFPEGELLCKLADILGVSLDALVGRTKIEIVCDQKKPERVKRPV